jgi:hypothetical protein
MKQMRYVLFAAIAAARAWAGAISYTGTLATPESTFTTTATLSSAGTLELQTWGFGGGTDAASAVIPAGGFDAFVGVFNSSGNLIQGTSDILTNYASFQGCPPAGVVTIGSITGQCGDVTMSLALVAGTYTILLSDAEYYPVAVQDSPSYGNLSEGFNDLTGGALPFATCADLSDCKTDTANWALDVSTSGAGAAAPEPGTFGICAAGLLACALPKWNQKKG